MYMEYEVEIIKQQTRLFVCRTKYVEAGLEFGL